MSSADLRGRSWVAHYVPIHGTRRVAKRIPVSVVPGDDTPAAKRLAVGYAAECDRYCRLLEGAPLPDHVQHAKALGIIPDDQAVRLLSGPQAKALPTRVDAARVTIATAAQAHPSSRRESLADQVRHARSVTDFVEHSGIDRLDELTVDRVIAWMDHLKSEGWKWDSRRHALLWIRRATAMAPSYQQSNILAGLHLNHRANDEDTTVEALTLDQLIATLNQLDPTSSAKLKPDPRARAAVALGGLLGLRPSETYRLQVGDLDLANAVLRVGVRKAKNRASRRDLPLPPTLVTWLRPLIAKRSVTASLIACKGLHWHSNPREGIWTASTFTQWLGPILRTASGTTVPAKALRKTFATWAVESLPVVQLEGFLGHDFSGASAVTARHYLAKQSIEKLRPAAVIIENVLSRLNQHTKSNTSRKALKPKAHN